MTTRQTLTVNLHHPQIQDVRRLDDEKIAVTFGNGEYHGTVTMMLTPAEWLANDYRVRRFLADKRDDGLDDSGMFLREWYEK